MSLQKSKTTIPRHIGHCTYVRRAGSSTIIHLQKEVKLCNHGQWKRKLKWSIYLNKSKVAPVLCNNCLIGRPIFWTKRVSSMLPSYKRALCMDVSLLYVRISKRKEKERLLLCWTPPNFGRLQFRALEKREESRFKTPSGFMETTSASRFIDLVTIKQTIKDLFARICLTSRH